MICKYCGTKLVLVHIAQDRDDTATVVVCCECSTYGAYPNRVIVNSDAIKPTA